ncbi:MAG: hypothetical protein K0S19_1090, partial [Geminicoccaceae bacterium]|nr:hypothetical protein [Geminicoccaceae bacterium]
MPRYSLLSCLFATGIAISAIRLPLCQAQS